MKVPGLHDSESGSCDTSWDLYLVVTFIVSAAFHWSKSLSCSPDSSGGKTDSISWRGEQKRHVAQGQPDRNGRNCCDHLCKQCNTVCSLTPINIIFNHSTCKNVLTSSPDILFHSGFRHGVQDLIIWSNADMNEYGKADILNILQTKKQWDQDMKQVTPLSARMKFIVVSSTQAGRIKEDSDPEAFTAVLPTSKKVRGI